jgi:D-alanyl-D-alanine carboxypeptidase (penicillin-binding protein 5/6)
MMTALVAIERFSLADPIVATPRSRSEPSIIGLDPGDRLSLENMLYGLLLPSGNDAALAIAETIGEGSIERFVEWMNERAAGMGLRNTRFTNPTGLDDSSQYSSARDLAEIARTLMAEPTLARIVATPRYAVQGPPLWFFGTTNPLLGTTPGVDGIKTGYTDEAGRCFAATAMRNGHRVVTVMLNSPNIAQEAQVLLDAGFAMARHVTLDVTRPGFARLVEERTPRPGRPVLALAGWETVLLRGFTTGEHTTVLLAGQPVARW